MTADRLDLDALEASVRQKEALFLTNVLIERETVAALIAAAREAKTLTDERYEWERMVYEREERTHRQIAKTSIARAEAERDAAQAALARLTADSMAARFRDEWLRLSRGGGTVNMFDIALDVVRAVAHEGQEAGG